MACILSRFIDREMVVEVVDLLQLCLSKNNLPSVRQYAEILGIQICLKYPSLIKERIVPALSDYNMKTQALASYVFISVNVLKHAAPVSLQKELIEEILPAVMPYFTTHHHPLRSFSQILMYEVLHKILKSQADWADHKYSLEKKCLQSIVSYLDGNIECKRIRVAVEKFISSFDPNMAATPRGIFSIHKEGEDDPSKPLDDIPFECAPIALMDEVSYFLNEAREDLRQSMTADAISLQSEEMYENIKKEEISNQPRTSQDGPSDFQRKIGSLRFSETPSTEPKTKNPDNQALRDNFSTLSVIEKEEELLQTTVHTRIEDLVKMRGNRQELIVVATLLGRIPNLAGLVRTCEVFKASSLILADASVLQDRQFQLISVTAEMWVPIKEVPESGLQEFLEVKMKEGFTLVGLEQTAHSISLEKYMFPKKTVLVLGKEKEGIPIDIIQILDACVEIPQLGVIRSLNVHVSGAIAIWEYTRQFLGST